MWFDGIAHHHQSSRILDERLRWPDSQQQQNTGVQAGPQRVVCQKGFMQEPHRPHLQLQTPSRGVDSRRRKQPLPLWHPMLAFTEMH